MATHTYIHTCSISKLRFCMLFRFRYALPGQRGIAGVRLLQHFSHVSCVRIWQSLSHSAPVNELCGDSPHENE